MFLFNNKPKAKDLNATVRDRPLRSIIKSITWRVVGTIDTITLSYFITGRINVALSIGSFEVITKMILYFLHERLWAVVRWGRMMVFFRRNRRNTARIFKRILLR